MKNHLKAFLEPQSIIKDEFLTFDCRFLTPSEKNVEHIFCLDQQVQNFTLISNLMSDFVYIAYLITFWTKYSFCILFYSPNSDR